MLDAARDLADLGYPVFPCRAGDKMPLVRHGFKQATRDERQILQWWDRWPDANIGIACAAAGIAVVDIDVRHGADPGQVTAQLPVGVRDKLVFAWTGVAPAPDERHPASLEGLRGAHLFFAADRARTGTLLDIDGVELRAQGSYVIAAPSLHPSGVRYEWVGRAGPPPVRRLPQLPPELQPRTPRERLPGAGALEQVTYTEGNRHRGLLDIAIDLMQKQIVAQDLLGGALAGANTARCRPPLPAEEVQRIIAWAAASDLAQRAQVTPLHKARS
jgi:hypothetical protein